MGVGVGVGVGRKVKGMGVGCGCGGGSLGGSVRGSPGGERAKVSKKNVSEEDIRRRRARMTAFRISASEATRRDRTRTRSGNGRREEPMRKRLVIGISQRRRRIIVMRMTGI